MTGSDGLTPLGVIGGGYVGLVTGVCFAALGHRVTIRDIDPAKIEMLNGGNPPIFEDGLAELMAEHADKLTYTLSMREMLDASEIVFIAVDTPPTHSGDADLSRVMTVVDEVAEVGDSDHILVMKSTVPVGTGAKVRAALDQRGLTSVGYVSNPEFLKEGVAIPDFRHPDRVVIGSSIDAQGDRVAALYDPVDTTVLRTSVPTAEMIKYASNAFLATKISFINEIANVCEEVGADVAVVADGMGFDTRIGRQFLNAGIGFGGSCFPKDVSALKQLAGNSGYHFQLLTSVIEVNELQKRRVIGKLKRHLGELSGKRIALLGLAFKPGTDDMREAASLVLAGRLMAEAAEVVAWDPVVHTLDGHLRGVENADGPLAAIQGADAVVIVTEWPEVKAVDWDEAHSIMRTPVVIDGRNILDPGYMTRAGFTYEGIGRLPSAVEDDGR